MLQQEETNLNNEIRNFLNNWHRFPIDFWWRKKYNIPFGSKKHRKANFIDMLIEYREQQMINDDTEKTDEVNDEDLGMELDGTNRRTVDLSQQEIDDDYENMDLEQFNKE